MRDDKAIVEEEPEDFQGVTRDELKIIGLTRLLLKFGGLLVTHPVLIAESIAHKLILGNNFMTEHKCDIINSDKVIQFGDQKVPFTLFRSTVNLICPVICTGATIIGPNEEVVIHCLLDAACQYEKGQQLLLEPRFFCSARPGSELMLQNLYNCLNLNTDKLEPFIIAHILVNFNSGVVPVLLSNVSSKPMMILKNKVLADETPLTPCLYQESEFPPLTVAAAATAAGANRKELNSIEVAMANANMALSLFQRSMLKS